MMWPSWGTCYDPVIGDIVQGLEIVQAYEFREEDFGAEGPCGIFYCEQIVILKAAPNPILILVRIWVGNKEELDDDDQQWCKMS